VRHDNYVFAGRRSAFPPVGQVEEVPSHDGRPDALPHRAHVADRVPGDLERPAVDDLGVAIEILEKRINVVLRIRDEAIDRVDRVHEYSAHDSIMPPIFWPLSQLLLYLWQFPATRPLLAAQSTDELGERQDLWPPGGMESNQITRAVRSSGRGGAVVPPVTTEVVAAPPASWVPLAGAQA